MTTCATKMDTMDPQCYVFSFTKENEIKIKKALKKYPEGRQASAVKYCLDLAQRQCGGWLPKSAIEAVAHTLAMPIMKVYEVATFYTMFNLKPVGKNFIRICKTTPCWLRGSDELLSVCKSKLGIDVGEMTLDGQFSLGEVECMGACVNAPMAQIGDAYFEDLTSEILDKMIDDLKAGKTLKSGPQNNRNSSEPFTGMTTLSRTEEKKS